MSRPKLLLADDSVTIQKVVNLTFAERGMDVIPFSDGEAALEHFDEVRPDIVLADVNMPGINGYQLCELLRTDNANRDLPVVLLVGSFEPFDRDEAQRVGATMHLTKPFTSIAELISKVEGLLQQAASAPEPYEATEAEAVTFEPETNDIDSLYEQSFAETVEIPKEEENEYEIAGIDDEMIQTSYAGPDPVDGQAYYTAENLDDLPDLSVPNEPTPEIDENPTPLNLAELTDVRTEAASDGVIAVEVASSSSVLEEIEPVVPSVQEHQSSEPGPAQEVRVYDPFDSPAVDPPPLDEADSMFSAVKLGFEEADLLDLPPLNRQTPVEHTVTKAADAGKEIANLSPELIEMIVQKVVERLEQKR